MQVYLILSCSFPKRLHSLQSNLLTNCWNHLARKRAARHFKQDWQDIDQRYRFVFETHEESKFYFADYMGMGGLFEKRLFTRNQFRDFMFARFKPYPQMLGLVARLKAQHGLRMVDISKESREVNAHRIHTFRLGRLVDAFISSCFAGSRNPDVAIFRLPLDVAQTAPESAIFIDNTQIFVQTAERPGDAKQSSCRL